MTPTFLPHDNYEKFLNAELSPRIIMKNMIVEVAKLMYSSENTYKRDKIIQQ